ncbi:MAG: hypothetical protein Q9175_001435 [Cornicularia normoerica]
MSPASTASPAAMPSMQATNKVAPATTLSCGAKFSTASGAIYTDIPRAQTNQVLTNIGHFCTPSDDGVGDTLTLTKGNPVFDTMRFDAPGLMLYRLQMVWDPRPECANIPAPEIRNAVPKGPGYWRQVYFDAITNRCDAGPGEDKHGGIMYAECVIWAWETYDGCSGKFAQENDC